MTRRRARAPVGGLAVADRAGGLCIQRKHARMGYGRERGARGGLRERVHPTLHEDVIVVVAVGSVSICAGRISPKRGPNGRLTPLGVVDGPVGQLRERIRRYPARAGAVIAACEDVWPEVRALRARLE